jgi:hypothetical protein
MELTWPRSQGEDALRVDISRVVTHCFVSALKDGMIVPQNSVDVDNSLVVLSGELGRRVGQLVLQYSASWPLFAFALQSARVVLFDPLSLSVASPPLPMLPNPPLPSTGQPMGPCSLSPPRLALSITLIPAQQYVSPPLFRAP